jgi:hypothetical protein
MWLLKLLFNQKHRRLLMSLEDDIITIKTDLATLLAAPSASAVDLTPITASLADLKAAVDAIHAQFIATPAPTITGPNPVETGVPAA